MIVKVLGLAEGECLQRQAETLDLWETPAKLRKMARVLANRYLGLWHNVDTVAIRRDDDHKMIARVKRKKS